MARQNQHWKLGNPSWEYQQKSGLLPGASWDKQFKADGTDVLWVYSAEGVQGQRMWWLQGRLLHKVIKK